MWDPQGPGVPTLEPAGWSGSEVQPQGAGAWAPPPQEEIASPSGWQRPGGARCTTSL